MITRAEKSRKGIRKHTQKANIDHIRQQLHHPNEPVKKEPPETAQLESETADNTAAKPRLNACPCCGGNMITIETFERGQKPQYQQPKYWPPPNWKKP